MSIQIENEINSLFEEIGTLCSQHTEVNPLITELTDIPIVKKVKAPRRPKEVIQAEKDAKALKAGARLEYKAKIEAYKAKKEAYEAMRVPSQWIVIDEEDFVYHFGYLQKSYKSQCLKKIRERGGLSIFIITYERLPLCVNQLVFIDAYDSSKMPWLVVKRQNVTPCCEWATFLDLNHTGDNGGMTPFPLENIENLDRVKYWVGNYFESRHMMLLRAMVIQDEDDGVLLK